MKGQGLAVFCRNLGLAGADDFFNQGKGEGVFRGEEHAGFAGFIGGAVDVWDDAAGMGVEAEVVGKGGVAYDHFAFRFWVTKAGHGVGHAFYVVGQ